MNTVRTTLRLPEELHQELILAAFSRKVSFNDLVKQKLMAVDTKQANGETNEEIEMKLHGFTAVASLLTGFGGAEPRTESHSSTGLHSWLSGARVMTQIPIIRLKNNLFTFVFFSS